MARRRSYELCERHIKAAIAVASLPFSSDAPAVLRAHEVAAGCVAPDP
jgi:hypothetical protein